MWAVAGGAIPHDRATCHEPLSADFSEAQVGLSAHSAHRGHTELPEAQAEPGKYSVLTQYMPEELRGL